MQLHPYSVLATPELIGQLIFTPCPGTKDTSVSQALATLREAGAKVNHVFVIFHYDIFPESRQVLKDIDVQLQTLATWWDVLRVAKQHNHFDTQTLDEVEKFLHAPAEWSGAHGGATAFPKD